MEDFELKIENVKKSIDELTGEVRQMRKVLDQAFSLTTDDAPKRAYRVDDGFSVGTSMGCRRHKAIDEVLDRFSVGDRFEKMVAQNAIRWFGFSPVDYPELAPESEEEREALLFSYNRNFFLTMIDVELGEFAVQNVPGSSSRSTNISHYGVVYVNSNKTPSEWAESHAKELLNAPERYRKIVERQEALNKDGRVGPRPSPLPPGYDL